VELGLVRVQIHPKYVYGEYYYDVAVLETKTVQLTPYIRPGDNLTGDEV
jgi:hypothetical protein